MSYISDHISTIENIFNLPPHEGQIQVINSFLNNKNIFLKGPSGTGKTFIFIYLIYLSLKNKHYSNCSIILSSKDDFYKSTIWEICYTVSKDVREFFDKFLFLDVNSLKGRTLSDTIVFVDDIQNFTKKQLNCIMSRIGNNSRILIAGDSMKSDIPSNLSCFDFAENVFIDMDSFESIGFYHEDIVRSEFSKEWISTIEPLIFG